jgi:membrane protein DedA with SNARE-associated domain
LHDHEIVADIARQLMAWLLQHTYAAVFVSTLIDATAIPFPGRIVLAAAGAFAAAGNTSALALIALGTGGVVLADHLWYFAGALGGGRLLRLYCRLTFSSPDCEPHAAGWLRRFGSLVIVVGRFVAVVRVFAWPLAREHGVGYLTFVLLDVPAALAWTALWVGLGWLLGVGWAEASAEVRWMGIGLACAAVLVVVVVRLRRRALTRRTGSGARASRGSPAIPRVRPRP